MRFAGMMLGMTAAISAGLTSVTAVRHNNRALRKEKNHMIKVVARTLVREECIEAYHELAREIVAETKKDRGMITYTMNQSTTDKRLHAMIEAWEDMESLQAHMASEHFKRIVPQMAQYAEEHYPPEIYTEL